jgi:hypothetical protein
LNWCSQVSRVILPLLHSADTWFKRSIGGI